MENKKIIEFVIGDWSRDGHEKTVEYYIETSFSAEEIENIYAEAVDSLEFDLLDFCNDYAENEISKEILDPVLLKINFDRKEIIDEDDLDSTDFEEDPYYYLWHDSYFEIYLAMIKYARPDIDLKRVEAKGQIQLGGYGLFD